MNWASVSTNIPPAVVSAQSVRAGGATALSSAGADWGSIQSRGRLKSFVFHEYVRRVFTGYLELGTEISGTSGIYKYLVEVGPRHKRDLFDATLPSTAGGN